MSNTQVAVSKIDSLKKMLDAPSVQEQFKNALKENSGTFVASIIDLYGGDSYLQNCEPKAVIMEALKAAILKLPINKSLGFAYIVPYRRGEALLPQFQIGYRGLIQLAMRTGQYRVINADIVYEGEYVTKNKLTGEFDLSGKATSQKIVGYFSHIEMLNGFAKTFYMTKEQVENHAKKYSKSYNTKGSAWQSDFDSMAIKTVLRNLLSHYGFLSIEMVGAIDTDNQDEDINEKINKEINQNANKGSIGFDDAVVVQEGELNGQPGF